MSEFITYRYRIHGVVQGVGFRAWSRRQATMLGIQGYARNRLDGSVEVMATGNASVVERFSQLLWKGPPGAVVDEVESEVCERTVSTSGFAIY